METVPWCRFNRVLLVAKRNAVFAWFAAPAALNRLGGGNER
jgi:hypothetical protein